MGRQLVAMIATTIPWGMPFDLAACNVDEQTIEDNCPMISTSLDRNHRRCEHGGHSSPHKSSAITTAWSL